MKFSVKENVIHILFTLLTALAVAMGMHVFVYPNNFAPGGVDGLSAILQTVTGLNAGLFVWLINMPLLIAAWFLLKRRYVLYTLLYTAALSLFLFLLAEVDFYQYAAGENRLLAALCGGIAQGLTGIMFRIGASSGGVDVMGSMVQLKLPHVHLERIISAISASVAILSFVVYGDLTDMLLSVVTIVACERVTAALLKDSRHAVKFEIVTPDAAPLKDAILYELGHGATLLPGRGLYSGRERDVVVCVVGCRQIPRMLKLLSAFPDTFVYFSDVMGVRGEFDRK